MKRQYDFVNGGKTYLSTASSQVPLASTLVARDFNGSKEIANQPVGF